MQFNSLVFVAFFAGVLALYWTLRPRARNVLLLLASYGFYAAWDWRFLGLIWLSTALDYTVGRVIHASDDPRVRRGALLVSLVGNLSLLSFFKYYGFFIESLDALVQPLGLNAAGLHLDLVLPVGISFYTFQTMSYAIDVYRGRMEAVRDPLVFALFVCFFPQLVAGPIERAPDLVPQFRRPRKLTREDLHEGFALALWGLFKKVVVADNLARVVDPVYAPGAQPGAAEATLATVAFAFQVYADFSAYSDIARGTARLLGVRLSQNFRLPYFARDMGEFWRRWHITLSTWLRDYVYFPLGGNRHREVRVAFNLWLTLLLAGLWHGSDGTFFAFGAVQGLLVVGARYWRRVRPYPEGRGLGWSAVLNFPVWCATLVFFRAGTLGQCATLFGSLAGPWRWSSQLTGDAIVTFFCALPIVIFDALWVRRSDELFVLSLPFAVRVAVYLAVGYAILLFGRWDGVEFVYFQF